MTVRLLEGDAIVRLSELEAGSIDACVTDPPAGISFMGRGWDGDKGGRRQWVAWMTEVFTEVYRVMKPGAHGLVWALPRTSHWTAWALEDAGFTVRDKIYHLTGQGFPKSLDVSKAIDKAADYQLQAQIRRAAIIAVQAAGLMLPGNSQWDWTKGEHAPSDKWWSEFQRWLPTLDDQDRERIEREIIGQGYRVRRESAAPVAGLSEGSYALTAPATPEAAQWSGWGTALKPAAEEWILIRKPLAEKTVAANVLAHGTGGLNIEGCRIGTTDDLNGGTYSKTLTDGGSTRTMEGGLLRNGIGAFQQPAGRWPANCVLSHSERCVEVGTKRVKGQDPHRFTKTTGGAFASFRTPPVVTTGDADGTETVAVFECESSCPVRLLDEQSGERKSGAAVRGTEPSSPSKNAYGVFGRVAGQVYADSGGASRFYFCAKASPAERRPYNDNPCVKPLKLCEWLVKLVTPQGGTVLDPFCGSGSILLAADRLGFSAVGIDSDPHAIEIARRRLTEDAGPLLNPLMEGAV